MKRQLPPLLALRAFELAARYLSISNAAAELHVTPGAVSRHIKALEQHLDQPLFHRLTRRIELTAFGQRYLAAISDGLDRIETATMQARIAPRTALRVSMTQSIASLWLMPRLSSFTEAHPGIDIQVVTSMQPVDFAREDIDLAIRLGRLPGRRYPPEQPRVPHELVTSWSGVVAEHLWDEVLTPVLSRTLLRRGPPLRTPQDLAGHTLLHVTVRSSAWPDWFRTRNLPYTPGVQNLEFGHFFMTLEAVRKDLGIALAPTLQLDNMAGRNGLVCPFPAGPKSAGEYYLLYREADSGDPRIALFRDWLRLQHSPGTASLPAE